MNELAEAERRERRLQTRGEGGSLTDEHVTPLAPMNSKKAACQGRAVTGRRREKEGGGPGAEQESRQCARTKEREKSLPLTFPPSTCSV